MLFEFKGKIIDDDINSDVNWRILDEENYEIVCRRREKAVLIKKKGGIIEAYADQIRLKDGKPWLLDNSNGKLENGEKFISFAFLGVDPNWSPKEEARKRAEREAIICNIQD